MINFSDIHQICQTIESRSIVERVNELSRQLPLVSICAIGGIPVKRIGDSFQWCGNEITADLLRSLIIDALGLSAVLTYTNKNKKTLESLGKMCAERNETWAYHWFTLTIALANQPPDVQLAFARDGRFRLSWVIEGNYTGSVFLASAGLHEWLKFTSKRRDLSFDLSTRIALTDCHELLEEMVP